MLEEELCAQGTQGFRGDACPETKKSKQKVRRVKKILYAGRYGSKKKRNWTARIVKN